MLSDCLRLSKKNQIDDLKNMRDTHNALIHAYKRDANLPASRIHNLEPGEFDRFMEQQEIEHQSEMKRLKWPRLQKVENNALHKEACLSPGRVRT